MNTNLNHSGGECKHEYAPSDKLSRILEEECIHCGLLKSTIESGVAAEYKNKAVRSKDSHILSPDLMDWSKEFDEKFPDPMTKKYGDGIKLYCSNCSGENLVKIKSFISSLLDQAREDYRKKERYDYWSNFVIGLIIGLIIMSILNYLIIKRISI